MKFNFPDAQDEKRLRQEIIPVLNRLKSKEWEVFLGGSIAKGTWLKRDYDIDIFIRFKKDGEISKRLGEYLKKKFNRIELLHGSRDYFRIKKGKYKLEIVPVLKINKLSEAKNITDISPLHVLWVRKNLNKKLADEVRKTKLFCKSNKLYGAESYIRGFSGYVLEILIAKYKSFENLLKNSSNWKQGQKIDIAGHGVKNLNKSKKSALIIIDPVQPDRNASASLSNEKFLLFKKTAKEYLKTRDEKYFRIQEINKDGYNLIIKARPLKKKEDVAGAKALKAFEFISRKLAEFGILRKEWEFSPDAAGFYFNLAKSQIPEKIVAIGPPLKIKEHVAAFKKRHKNTFTKNNRIYAHLTRKKISLKEIIREILKDNYLKDKAGSFKIIKVF